jgi:hypothetical protein
MYNISLFVEDHETSTFVHSNNPEIETPLDPVCPLDLSLCPSFFFFLLCLLLQDWNYSMKIALLSLTPVFENQIYENANSLLHYAGGNFVLVQPFHNESDVSQLRLVENGWLIEKKHFLNISQCVNEGADGPAVSLPNVSFSLFHKGIDYDVFCLPISTFCLFLMLYQRSIL